MGHRVIYFQNRYFHDQILKTLCRCMYEDYVTQEWKPIIWYTQESHYHPSLHPATAIEVNWELDENDSLVEIQSYENDFEEDDSEDSSVENDTEVETGEETRTSLRRNFWEKCLTVDLDVCIEGHEDVYSGTCKICLRDIFFMRFFIDMQEAQDAERLSVVNISYNHRRTYFDSFKDKGVDFVLLWDSNIHSFYKALWRFKVKCRTIGMSKHFYWNTLRRKAEDLEFILGQVEEDESMVGKNGPFQYVVDYRKFFVKYVFEYGLTLEGFAYLIYLKEWFQD